MPRNPHIGSRYSPQSSAIVLPSSWSLLHSQGYPVSRFKRTSQASRVEALMNSLAFIVVRLLDIRRQPPCYIGQCCKISTLTALLHRLDLILKVLITVEVENWVGLIVRLVFLTHLHILAGHHNLRSLPLPPRIITRGHVFSQMLELIMLLTIVLEVDFTQDEFVLGNNLVEGDNMQRKGTLSVQATAAMPHKTKGNRRNRRGKQWGERSSTKMALMDKMWSGVAKNFHIT